MIFENFKWRSPKPCMCIYLGEEEKDYNDWLNDDPDGSMAKPSPTYILSEDEMNQLTISWLTGPPGPVGPMGPMGMKGDPA